jgi:hypothetical protein
VTACSAANKADVQLEDLAHLWVPEHMITVDQAPAQTSEQKVSGENVELDNPRSEYTISFHGVTHTYAPDHVLLLVGNKQTYAVSPTARPAGVGCPPMSWTLLPDTPGLTKECISAPEGVSARSWGDKALCCTEPLLPKAAGSGSNASMSLSRRYVSSLTCREAASAARSAFNLSLAHCRALRLWSVDRRFHTASQLRAQQLDSHRLTPVPACGRSSMSAAVA